MIAMSVTLLTDSRATRVFPKLEAPKFLNGHAFVSPYFLGVGIGRGGVYCSKTPVKQELKTLKHQ